jgi:hypothetical protein
MDDVAAMRVAYRRDQHLGSREFRSEQAYHLAMRWRHNIAHHDWGIVRGLELHAPGVVEAGFAIDGYGRELILEQRQSLPLDQGFYDIGGDVLDVWLVYGRREADGVFIEEPRLELTAAAPPGTDRRHPAQVAPEDASFDATRLPPDDPTRLWPVYLGSVQRDPTDPNKPKRLLTTGRPYVGARAGTIAAPGSLATMSLGETFTVDIDDPAGKKRVIKSNDDGMSIAGELDVDGDLVVGSGTIVFAGTVAGSNQPWRIERVKPPDSQLRIVVPDHGEVVIGAWKDGTFTPCLTVTSDGDVEVAGNLIVDGAITP